MSLTSVELNYLVWRYLQESGFELAAYAFDKKSRCLDYAHPLNKTVDILQPGCLPNLVQKGILYALLEDNMADKEKLLTLVQAVLSDIKAMKDDLLPPTEGLSLPNSTSELASELESEDVLHKEEENTENTVASDTEMLDVSFKTKILTPTVECKPSIAASWHPSTTVIALGMNDLTGCIHALSSGNIAESVLLSHPPIINGDTIVPNPISLVAWDPAGTMLVTAGANGEMRAWSPDGHLKNVANSVTDLNCSTAPLSSIIWNNRGLLVFTIDLTNTFRLWDGATLALLQEMRDLEPETTEICALWLGDKKFALSTSRNTIKIYSAGPSDSPDDLAVICVGQLAGHSHQITNLSFGPICRLLASLSDVDYSIKVWNSQSSQDAIELNTTSEKLPNMHYHTTPIIGLHWVNRPGDVQGSELLSVSMDGSVNVWDAFTGDSLISANVFQNSDNFQFEDEQDPEITTKNSLVFASAVSPNGKYLALGDDSGTISVWDISVSNYTDQRDLLRCLGVFSPSAGGEAGICELVWDKTGKYLSSSYQGAESFIFEWPQS